PHKQIAAPSAQPIRAGRSRLTRFASTTAPPTPPARLSDWRARARPARPRAFHSSPSVAGKAVPADHLHVTAFAEILFMPMAALTRDSHQRLELAEPDRGYQPAAELQLLDQRPRYSGHRR